MSSASSEGHGDGMKGGLMVAHCGRRSPFIARIDGLVVVSCCGGFVGAYA